MLKITLIFLLTISSISMIYAQTSVFDKTKITWLGHAALLIKTQSGREILIDPFISKNPKTPKKYKDMNLFKGVDLILITHGHGDHMGDYKQLLKLAPKAKITMNSDLGKVLLKSKQISKSQYIPFNKSGTITPFNNQFKVTQVRAEHSSSVIIKNKVHYGGEPVGFILEFKDGKKIYHAGDTGMFGDMKLIGDFYKPDIAFLPIGGNYTMGPKEAAYVTNNFLKPKVVVPIHFQTFPILKGSSKEFQNHLGKSSSKLLIIKPGNSTSL